MAKLCAGGVTLRDQINKRWPKRDKSSDGWIGDASHQANSGWGTNGKGSYHNPDPKGIVHAIDIDENMGVGDDRKGQTAKEFAEQLAAYCREGKDNGRIAHIVYEDQVASATANNWHFRGSGYGHKHHIHISFTNKADNDGSKFDLPIFEEEKKPAKPSSPQEAVPFPGVNFLKFGERNEYVKAMQRQLIKKGFDIKHGESGNYFQKTQQAVKEFYRSLGWTSDGKKMGPKAWDALWRNQ